MAHRGGFGAAGAGAAFAGAAVNRLLDPRVMLVGFAALMVAAALRMLREQVPEGGDCTLPGGGVNWRGCLPKAIASGLAVGFLAGLFGVGGGFRIIPALVLLLGLPMSVAVGTSLLIVVINSAAGFVAHAGDPAGLPAGRSVHPHRSHRLVPRRPLAPRLPADRLRRWFAYLVLAIAAFVVAQALLNPTASG